MVQQRIIKFIITLVFLAIGFIFAGGRDNKEAVNETQISIPGIDTTKLEKYERKVIIKAKVGKEPGEIGVIGEGPIPEGEALWEGSMEGPKGIAVDNVGYIFVLDALNKRILKFSPEGGYIKAINLANFDNSLLLGSTENRLFIDSEGNFFIKERAIKLDEKIRCICSYDKNGKLLRGKQDMPRTVSHMKNKSVSSTISKFTIIKGINDTIVWYYIDDSTTGEDYAISVYLPKREGWEYMITPYSFLGFDEKGNSYIKVDAFKQTPNLLPKELTEFIREEEELVFKFNEKGKLVAMIREVSPGRCREMWALDNKGTLYLMKYAFKTVEVDELPEWVKDSDMSEEAKKYWRRRYTAPEGFVYVVKFPKVEER